MASFLNPEFPVSNADCAEIEAIFIELIRVWVGAAPGKPVDLAPQFVDPRNVDPRNVEPPNNAQDLRSQWGLQ